uniref:Uncharacterized protein n=1 Tax=Glossina austeni TaxID=7395 RepID=A0A1A9UDC3_GLOAU
KGILHQVEQEQAPYTKLSKVSDLLEFILIVHQGDVVYSRGVEETFNTHSDILSTCSNFQAKLFSASMKQSCLKN